MKTFICTLLSLFVLLPAILFSQTQTYQGIAYSYDAAGNRIHRAGNRVKREPAPQQQGRKAAPSTKEKKETAVVSKNNLHASFTPNPTTSGNFAVVVSKSNLPINEKTATLENLQIFIYNPLGELIHQDREPNQDIQIIFLIFSDKC